MPTPPFLVWSIGQACPLRELVPLDQPEKVERHLRSARAFSEARREGRIFEGLAVAEPLGFRVEETLAIYGGLPTLETNCRGCPANALEAAAPGSLAGCLGMLALDDEAVLNGLEGAIDRAGLTSTFAALFPPTLPRWYGVWLASPLSPHQCDVLGQVLEMLLAADSSLSPGWRDLQLALFACTGHGLPLFGQLFPQGEVQGTWWQIVPHCGRCQTAWQVPWRGCEVCGSPGPATPGKKRRVRGTRPYFPLTRLLGEEQAADFVARYRVARLKAT